VIIGLCATLMAAPGPAWFGAHRDPVPRGRAVIVAPVW
jgi:hypothetical protein